MNAQDEMMTLNEKIYKGGDKIKAYGWKLLDNPGLFKEIPKTILKIDYSYQRNASPSDSKIKRIASQWSWIACGALLVAERGGKLFVVDGQHRALAAMKRSDITHLPCMVYQSEDAVDEAKGFLQVNTERKNMKSFDKYRAKLRAGDPDAVFLQKLVDSYGLTVSGGQMANGFQAPAVLLSIIEKDRGLASRVFDLCYKLSHPTAIQSDLPKGFADLDGRLDGLNVGSKRFVDRVLSVGRDPIIKSIASAKAFCGVGGGKVVGEGIMIAINHRLKNKIEAHF